MHPDHRVFQEVAQLRFPQRQGLLRLLNLAGFLFEGLGLLLRTTALRRRSSSLMWSSPFARDNVIVRGTIPRIVTPSVSRAKKCSGHPQER